MSMTQGFLPHNLQDIRNLNEDCTKEEAIANIEHLRDYGGRISHHDAKVLLDEIKMG